MDGLMDRETDLEKKNGGHQHGWELHSREKMVICTLSTIIQEDS